MSRATLLAILLAFVVGCSSCVGGRTVFAYSVATGGDAHRGKQLIEQYGCGSCHTIPGIREAEGLVGPPLILMGRRTYIAGELPNSPENLQKWLLDPISVNPATAMPKLGLKPQQAQDIAAYLFTLRSKSWKGDFE